MSDLDFARAQMTVSLAFHILFAVAGMAMPLLMLIAGVLHARTGASAYEALMERWAKGTAILFAVGAVSGTVLSFELGLLWPRFMQVFGPVVGLAFGLEGWAFFLEAIFLGFLLYGKGRISPKFRIFAASVVALAGLASGVFVMAVNAFMHAPSGVELTASGELGRFSPWAPFASEAFPSMASHMALAAYASVSVLVLGIHAAGLRRAPSSAFHAAAVRIALGVAVVVVPAQIVTGDWSAKHVASHQPIKLAAAEGLFETATPASLAIGGWPDVEARTLRGAIHVPRMLSILAFGDPNATVRGLNEFPREQWPNVPLIHIAFQIMVFAGSVMLGVVGLGAVLWWRRQGAFQEVAWYLRLASWAAPLGLIAVEAGWVVTECGRQPWLVFGLMRVKDAVVPMAGLAVPFTAFTVLYLVLGGVVIAMLRAHVLRAPAGGAK